MLPASAAEAHATLQGTDPANGSVVGSVPAQIGLTFDHAPLALGSVIRVEDATGTDRADGSVTIVDNHVTQALKPGAPEGKYTVSWRVASTDGHAIEGTFTFTAGPANTTSPATPAPWCPRRNHHQHRHGAIHGDDRGRSRRGPAHHRLRGAGRYSQKTAEHS